MVDPPPQSSPARGEEALRPFHALRKSTMRLELVPRRLFATPQMVAVLVKR